MIAYIDRWLDSWALWRRDRDLSRLGYASQSPVYRMMTSHAETKKTGYAQKRHVVTLHGGRKVARHTDPMRCVGTPSFQPQRTDDNPMCEAMELAVCDLPGNLKDVILIKYVSQFSDQTGANMMGISKGGYQNLVNYAHHGLDGWLKAAHPALVIRVRLEAPQGMAS